MSSFKLATLHNTRFGQKDAPHGPRPTCQWFGPRVFVLVFRSQTGVVNPPGGKRGLFRAASLDLARYDRCCVLCVPHRKPNTVQAQVLYCIVGKFPTVYCACNAVQHLAPRPD